MKLIALFALGLSILPWAAEAQEVIRPSVATAFGKPCTVVAEFVAKSNTYYDQNIIDEPFLLKVHTVNGKALASPVTIQYRFAANQAKGLDRKGQRMTFEAYETVYQPALANPWPAAGEQAMSFTLMHVLEIRVPSKQAAQPKKGK